MLNEIFSLETLELKRGRGTMVSLIIRFTGEVQKSYFNLSVIQANLTALFHVKTHFSRAQPRYDIFLHSVVNQSNLGNNTNSSIIFGAKITDLAISSKKVKLSPVHILCEVFLIKAP